MEPHHVIRLVVLEKRTYFRSTDLCNLTMLSSSFKDMFVPIISKTCTFQWLPGRDYQIYSSPSLSYLHIEGQLPPLPSNCLHITMVNSFSPSFSPFILLPNLKSLITGNHFDYCVDHLPNSLTYIKFGSKFNHPVDHLPPQLQYLEFDHLPTSLRELHLICYIKEPIPFDNLPEGLQVLFIHHISTTTVDNLPRQLKTLKYYCLDFPYHDHLPPSLTVLHFGQDF